MTDLLLFISALAGTILCFWAGYAEYAETTRTAARPEQSLGEPGSSLLGERATER